MQDILGRLLKTGDKVYYYEFDKIKLGFIKIKNSKIYADKKILLSDQVVKNTDKKPKSFVGIKEYLPIYGPYSRNEIHYWIYNNYPYPHISRKDIRNILNLNKHYITSVTNKYRIKKSKAHKERLALWLVFNYHITDLTKSEIEKKFMVSNTYLTNLIRKLDLKKRKKEVYRKAKKWLKENYPSTNLSLNQLEKKLNVSSKTLSKYVDELGLEKLPTKFDLLEEWMLENYKNTRKSDKQIARDFDVTVTSIYTIKKRHGLLRNFDSQKNYEVEKWLLKHFETTKLSIKEIGQFLGISESAVYYHTGKLGLSRKVDRPLEDWLLENFSDSSLYYYEIGELFDKSVSSVQYYINKHNLTRKSKIDKVKTWLLENYEKSPMTGKEMASYLKITQSSLSLYKRELGLIKDPKVLRSNFHSYLRDEWPLSLLSRKEVAQRFNKAYSTVTSYINRHNIIKKPKSQIARHWLINNYYNSNLNLKDISILLKINKDTLISILKDLDYDVVNVINKKPLRLAEIYIGILPTTFFKKHYPDLYNYLKHKYYGELSVKGIARKYNIDSYYLERMMSLLNVLDYNDYDLTPIQIKWIVNNYRTYMGSMKSIFELDIFNKSDRKEFERFISGN